MSAQATQAEPHDDSGPHDADTQGHRQVLHDLISMGADFARFLHGHAAAQAAPQAMAHPTPQATDTQQPTEPQPAPASDALISLTLAFDRTARAVRRSILLARSLADPVQPPRDPAQHRAAARRRIIREVEDAIQRTSSIANGGCDGAETLQAELRDRLDAPDLDDDITTRPTTDIISELCRDLGLAAPPGGAHPWKRRTPQDVTQLCADAAAPSGTRQPGPEPQTLKRNAAQPFPGARPDKHAARSHAQPGPIHAGPIHAGSDPPGDTAETLATILRHPTRVHGRWRPPPAP